ncbi:hypothetical protein ACA910_001325 [Epithemia clementina (nom. ined.)]
MSLTDVTVVFFVDNFPVGFALDKDSTSWNDDPNEKRHLRNLSAWIQRAVRMVLMHSNSYPPSVDKETVSRIASLAKERIRVEIGFDSKTITMYKLCRHERTKELEKSMSLPSNNPEEMQRFFKND